MALAFVPAGCTYPGGAVPTQARAEPPPTDCRAWVGVDRNHELPGYLLPQPGGHAACVPLGVTAHRPPAGYKGDYYVDEFADARLKERWRTCKADAACFARIDAQMQRWLPPNKARSTRSTGTVDPSGKIDPDGAVDLREIRRPAFFAKAPYAETIARADASTYIVEFTVPRDTFERIDLKMTDPVKLRGWYIEGRGVDDGKGGITRALVVMAPGGGGQLTAIQHPDEKPYRIDPATGRAVDIRFPNATTETMGQRWWRENLDALNQAGFDVLAYDRRGEGISGGFSDTNTLEQGEDVFRVLAQFDTGEGMRLLAPDGRVLAGDEAAGRLLGGMKSTRIPILLGGYSRGSMSTAWAMTKNFSGACSYDMPVPECTPPKGLANIKGAILLASFASGAGYLPSSPDLSQLGAARGHAQVAGCVLRQGFVGPCGNAGGHRCGLRPHSRRARNRGGPRTPFDRDLGGKRPAVSARADGRVCQGGDCRWRHCAGGQAVVEPERAGRDHARFVGAFVQAQGPLRQRSSRLDFVSIMLDIRPASWKKNPPA
jgi:hypothetical protein